LTNTFHTISGTILRPKRFNSPAPLALFQDTMAAILDHLKHVAMKADVNKMPVANLAVCFGPVLLCPSISPTAGDAEVAEDFKRHTEVLAYLLDIWPENRGELEGEEDRALSEGEEAE
jgi:hypothetical protein